MHPFPTSLEDMETLLRFPMELSERTLAFDAKDIMGISDQRDR